MSDRITARLRERLLTARNRDGGWPYQPGNASRLEPTSWVMLAMPELAEGTPLAAWQSPSGLLVEPSIGIANAAFNAVAALAVAATVPASLVSARSIEALIGQKGLQADGGSIVLLDGSLQGWSWLSGTFSWVEPTAWCMLALKKLAPQRPAAVERVREAERMLRDRACAGGGWNYGNPVVYSKQLAAHVPPTAAAVLSMQDRGGEAVVQRALEYLGRQALKESSVMALATTSLAFAVIGVPADALLERLRERLPIAEDLGNLASLAMMLYALEVHAHGTPPGAFTLS